MKKTIWNSAALLLAMVMVVSVFTVPAFAKSGKVDKKTPSAACNGFAAITLDQAKEIALEHAGVDSTDAVFSRAKQDKTVYELKFSALWVKYEYEIAADGTILSCKAEVKEHAEISQSQACQIALDDAGLDGETLKYITCYVSWVDHAPYAYEVKFSTRTANYHYTIDLDSGTILDRSSTSSVTNRTTAPFL